MTLKPPPFFSNSCLRNLLSNQVEHIPPTPFLMWSKKIKEKEELLAGWSEEPWKKLENVGPPKRVDNVIVSPEGLQICWRPRITLCYHFFSFQIGGSAVDFPPHFIIVYCINVERRQTTAILVPPEVHHAEIPDLNLDSMTGWSFGMECW